MLAPGQTLEAWRVGELLGSGGFARVLRGEPLAGGPPVALKQGLERGGSRFTTRVLGAAHARALGARAGEPHSVGPAEVDAALLAEAALLERAGGAAGLPRLLGCCEDAGRPVLVLELVPGESLLHRRVRGAPLPLAPLARLARELAAAIRNGLLDAHGDLKPSNLLLDEPSGALRPIDPAPPELLTPEYDPLLLHHAGADAVALAGVVYQAATGQAPFPHDPAPAAARAGDPISLGAFLALARPPLASFRPDLPAPLVDAVEAAFQPASLLAPGDPARLEELAERLEGLVAAGVTEVATVPAA